MEERDPTRCVQCGTSEDERRLSKCPVCHNMFCDECTARYSGRGFCSQSCGQFFFRDDDESDGDGGSGSDSGS